MGLDFSETSDKNSIQSGFELQSGLQWILGQFRELKDEESDRLSISLPSQLVSPLCPYEELAVHCPSLATQTERGNYFSSRIYISTQGKDSDWFNHCCWGIGTFPIVARPGSSVYLCSKWRSRANTRRRGSGQSHENI